MKILTVLLVCMMIGLIGCDPVQYECPVVYRATGNGEHMVAFATPDGHKKAYISITNMVKLARWLENGGADLDEQALGERAEDYIMSERGEGWRHPAGGVCHCRKESVKKLMEEGYIQ